MTLSLECGSHGANPKRHDLATAGWKPLDPAIYRLIAATAYAAAAVACWRAHSPAAPDEQRAWGALSLVMAALVAIELFDLQNILTVTGRNLAKAEGWYVDRRIAQWLTIGAVAAVGSIGALVLFRARRTMSRSLRAAIAAAGLLFMFMLIRATSLHVVDVLINSRLVGVRVDHALELSGIAIVTICSFMRRRTQQTS